MESIESLAISMYQKNIEFFEKNHPQVMKKLHKINQSLENGSYTSKYDLEYVDNYFDIKELRTSEYLYAQNSEEISRQITNKINYSKESNSFEGFPIYYTSKKTMESLDDRAEGFGDLLPIMNYYIDNIDESDVMKKIDKFIFIGTGLGFHITQIDKKIEASEYFIIEDDIEIFRLSLFTTSYYELAEHNNLYFSIADNENEFLTTFKHFLKNTFFYNRFLKLSYFGAHSDNKIKQIQNGLSSQSFAFFPYKQELKKYLRPLEYINDGYKVLNISKHFDNSLFADKPILLLAAGPTFQKHIEWLKKNHKRFIIVAISAVLNTLYKHNIKPDIITHIDGYEGSMPLFKNIPTKEFLKDTIVIFGPFAFPKLRELFSKEQIFYDESNISYFEGFGLAAGPCVGSDTLILSLIFNAKEIYLLGLNLALDQKTGSSHSEDYEDKKIFDLSEKTKLRSHMSSNEGLHPVQGNFTEIVYSTAVTHSSVQFLHENIKNVKQDNQVVYNLNEGAKIFDTIPTHIGSIDIDKYAEFDKSGLYKHLYEEFSNNSAIKLRERDVAIIKNRLHVAKEIKKMIDKYINNVTHANIDKYLYDMLGIVSDITHAGNRLLHNVINVYYTYFEYVLPLVMDLFNTKGLKNEKRHIKKLDKMFVQGMLNIDEMYEQALERFIKERC